MVKRKAWKLVKDEGGTLYILILVFLFLIICVMLVTSEVLRVHDLKAHLDDEIYRAANLSIKTAMYDSYRIDSTSKFDETVAVEYFYTYLKEDLHLNGSFEKLNDNGEIEYTLVINKVSVNGDTVRMNVRATAFSPTLFHLWEQKWEIPIDVLSKNIRTD
ncbi:hypothetical protein Ami103574_10780 [Aminipila butyrica]|uniref:Uncharacterized protein n=1 Tax=Aminipila butyrica TaxID=433296 RepID=A0A858BYJ1_9FIRM|nr:hypothetical protein [Aminipila butyrica]QIB69774.1 hypothetical protein Ami103574_10780 [Aminipila butyrica]